MLNRPYFLRPRDFDRFRIRKAAHTVSGLPVFRIPPKRLKEII